MRLGCEGESAIRPQFCVRSSPRRGEIFIAHALERRSVGAVRFLVALLRSAGNKSRARAINIWLLRSLELIIKDRSIRKVFPPNPDPGFAVLRTAQSPRRDCPESAASCQD